MGRIRAIAGVVLLLTAYHVEGQSLPNPGQQLPAYPPQFPPGYAPQPPSSSGAQTPFPPPMPDYGYQMQPQFPANGAPMPFSQQPMGYGNSMPPRNPPFPPQAPGSAYPPMPPGYGPQMPPQAGPGYGPPGAGRSMPNLGGPGYLTGGLPGAPAAPGPAAPPVGPPATAGDTPVQPPADPGDDPEYGPPASMPMAPSGAAESLPLGGLMSYIEPPYENPFPVFWASAEWLYWWYRNPSVSIPLITTNADPVAAGFLGEPGTQVIFGAGSPNGPSYRPVSGGRVNAGWWLGGAQTIGVEGNAFVLERAADDFDAASPGRPAPIVAIPFFATQPIAGEAALGGGGGRNAIHFHIDSQLWGAEGNVLMNLVNAYVFRAVCLCGYRYLNFDENLSLSETLVPASGKGSIVFEDQFGARNQFNGGQVGAKLECVLGRFSLAATGKIALGSTYQTLTINGTTTVTHNAFGLTNGVTPAGVLAQPSNIGTFTQNPFAYVPEGQVQMRFLFNRYMSAMVGYNFLYISNVIRTGDQLNRVVNPTQNPVLIGGGVVGTPAPPPPSFVTTDFWAQGLSVGLELRY